MYFRYIVISVFLLCKQIAAKNYQINSFKNGTNYRINHCASQNLYFQSNGTKLLATALSGTVITIGIVGNNEP